MGKSAKSKSTAAEGSALGAPTSELVTTIQLTGPIICPEKTSTPIDTSKWPLLLKVMFRVVVVVTQVVYIC